MEYEWDPEKDLANFVKHRISFADAVAVFLDPAMIEENSTRPEFGEERRKAIGLMGDDVTTVVFTMRGSSRRIISARKARRDERARYRQGHPAG